MAIVTFYNSSQEQVGCTSSAVAVATQMAIQHNMKILLLTTSLNDNIIKESFFVQGKKNKLSFLMVNDNNNIDRTGIEGLDRVLRSNKISPSDITNYTRVILTNRLEVLMGVEGGTAQYEIVKQGYKQIIELANRYYDIVIVDLDKKVGENNVKEILEGSDVVVNMISQRANQIEEAKNKIEKLAIDKDAVIYGVGTYMSNTKYNAKNITRNIIKSRFIVNTVPYNNLFFESTQEGTIIDLFLSFMKIREKDTNYVFVKSVNDFSETILGRVKIIQMKKGL